MCREACRASTSGERRSLCNYAQDPPSLSAVRQMARAGRARRDRVAVCNLSCSRSRRVRSPRSRGLLRHRPPRPPSLLFAHFGVSRQQIVRDLLHGPFCDCHVPDEFTVCTFVVLRAVVVNSGSPPVRPCDWHCPHLHAATKPELGTQTPANGKCHPHPVARTGASPSLRVWRRVVRARVCCCLLVDCVRCGVKPRNKGLFEKRDGLCSLLVFPRLTILVRR